MTPSRSPLLDEIQDFKHRLDEDPEAGLLGEADAIVRATAARFDADVAALFVVRKQELTLASAIALQGGEELETPSRAGTPLAWDRANDANVEIGILGYSAIRGEALFIPSYEALEQHPAFSGKLNAAAYPNGATHPETGFGCLYAVPLLVGEGLSPRDALIGLLCVERRSAAPAFDEIERARLDAVAEHLTRALLAARGADSPAFAPRLDVEVESLAPTDATADASDHARDRLLLEKIASGFAELTIADTHKRAALANIESWLTRSKDTRAQLERLVEKARWALLLDSFYRVLPFGTGGRRGPVGVGTNRFNAFTLAGSVQGHIDFLREKNPGAELSVVIVFDVRTFYDLRGLYDPELPNPLLGASSRDFARIAAEVYAGNGVHVYMPREDADWFVATPELSFTIRALGATGGLNISASHNFPDDNGGKFYNRHGGQEVPPNDEDMAKRVESARWVRRLPYARAKEAGLISFIGPEVHRDYLALNVAQSLRPESRDATIVFSPLHGSGDSSAGAAMRRAGFRVELVASQSTLDGRFPEVPFRAPNPEVPESFEQSIALARELDADLVMSCDPDADRIGVVSKVADGEYAFVNGNEISALVTHYKLDQLKKLGRLPAKPVVIKTEVTTEILRAITDDFGGAIVGDLLVGFKYHGWVLEQIETPPAADDPRPRPLERLGIEATLEDFVVATEESHGVLVTPEVRDKDAAGAAVLLAELAAVERARGRTVYDYLQDLFRLYGYYSNRLTSMVMTGAEGLEAIKKIQNVLRENPPETIAGLRVVEAKDHLDTNGIFGPILSETDRASRDVLVYQLENGARLIIRPSGTEPKNKTYIEVPSAEALGLDADREALERQKAETEAITSHIADDFTMQMLAIIGVHLPLYALRISGLVPLDKRQDFVERFIPAFEAQAMGLAEDPSRLAATSDWVDASLADYGKDARELVRAAFHEYLEEARTSLARYEASADAPNAAVLDAMERAFADR